MGNRGKYVIQRLFLIREYPSNSPCSQQSHIDFQKNKLWQFLNFCFILWKQGTKCLHIEGELVKFLSEGSLLQHYLNTLNTASIHYVIWDNKQEESTAQEITQFSFSIFFFKAGDLISINNPLEVLPYQQQPTVEQMRFSLCIPHVLIIISITVDILVQLYQVRSVLSPLEDWDKTLLNAGSFCLGERVSQSAHSSRWISSQILQHWGIQKEIFLN